LDRQPRQVIHVEGRTSPVLIVDARTDDPHPGPIESSQRYRVGRLRLAHPVADCASTVE
jgi:hypothetical protein